MDEPTPGTGAFSARQEDILAVRGIDPAQARAYGVRAAHRWEDLPDGAPDYWTAENGYLPGLLFRWESPTGEVEWQLRPDDPPQGKDGRAKKYVFRSGARSLVHAARPVEPGAAPGGLLMLTEGTCQTLVASLYAPVGVPVYGIAGCQSWMQHGVPTGGLRVVEGRDVLVVLDADAGTNLNVYEAGVKLRDALRAEGAATVRFLRVPGGAKSGLDDVLAQREPEDRQPYMVRLVEMTQGMAPREKPEMPAAAKPKAKKRDRAEALAADPSLAFFGETGGLLVETLASDVQGSEPVALTREGSVAVYRGGVFMRTPAGLQGAIGDRLREAYRASHVANVESYLQGQLEGVGATLPDHLSEPMLNVRNGMLDLRTGELHPHDARWLSSVQLPVDWDPKAQAPVYEAWLLAQIPQQADHLEEAASMMLDGSRTPTKAVFLFGPSRSGKSTFIRLLEALAGPENTSAVTLHMLAENRFAAANVYGAILNAAADLKADHVDDLSMFKMMTGDDLIQADRKFGRQFVFRNRALFVFSANTLPTVGESSRAYSERILPFHFDQSFAGAEDPALEEAMRAELSGILTRLVRAWQRRAAAGRPMVTDSAVRERFEMASDRVRQFIRAACEVEPTDTMIVPDGSTTTTLYKAFKDWAADEGKAQMAKSKFTERLQGVPGVTEVRFGEHKARGWNVRILPKSDWNSHDQVAKVAELNYPCHVENRTSSSNDHEGEVVNSQGWASSSTLPPLPPRQGRVTAVDDLFATLGDATLPKCDTCRAPMLIIDGTWFACPHCDKATVATRPGWE